MSKLISGAKTGTLGNPEFHFGTKQSNAEGSPSQ